MQKHRPGNAECVDCWYWPLLMELTSANAHELNSWLHLTTDHMQHQQHRIPRLPACHCITVRPHSERTVMRQFIIRCTVASDVVCAGYVTLPSVEFAVRCQPARAQVGASDKSVISTIFESNRIEGCVRWQQISIASLTKEGRLEFGHGQITSRSIVRVTIG